MGVIDPDNLKWYPPTNNVADTATYGGIINTDTALTDNSANNLWDNVTNTQRVAGLTEYRKPWFRNENADDYTNATLWLETNTPATGDTVWIHKAGWLSQAGTAVALSVTATFTQGSTLVQFSTSPVGQVAVGEKIYNSVDDNLNYGVAVQEVGATYIYLWSNYLGTAGDWKTVSVSSAASFASWVQPAYATSSDAFAMGTLAQNATYGIWVKRIVTAGAGGYKDNSYVLKYQDN